eukprot:513696_1
MTHRYCGDIINSDSFKVNGNMFQCILYPKGESSTVNFGYIGFHLKLKTFAENISQITIHYKLYCPQSKVFYKDTATIKRHNIQEMHWNLWSMKLSQYANTDSLNFLCSIEILNIKYNESLKGMLYKTHTPIILIPSQIEYEWNIRKQLLNTLKTELDLLKGKSSYMGANAYGNYLYQKTYHVGNYFENGCFSLVCRAVMDQFDHETGAGVDLCLYLYRLPAKIKYIDIKCKQWMLCNGELEDVVDNDEEYDGYTKKLSYGDNDYCFGRCFDYDVRENISWNVEQLSFKIMIQVIGIYDWENNKIEKEEWNKYGIILSRKHERELIEDNTKNILNDVVNTAVYGFESKK